MPGNESELMDDSSDVASENEYDAREEHDEDMAGGSAAREEMNGGREVKKAKLDPKDPMRPRRKKARRACFACQRAHLTCGMFSSWMLWGWFPSSVFIAIHRSVACFDGRVMLRLWETDAF